MKLSLIIVCLLLISSPSKASKSNVYPALIGKTVDGKNFNLTEKRGNVVIVNFWATWCAYCKQEMLVLDKIYQDYKSQGLEIVEISIDEKQNYQKVLKHAASKDHVNLMINDVKKNDFGYPEGVPDSYVINRKGKLVAAIDFNEKPINKKTFEDILKPLFR